MALGFLPESAHEVDHKTDQQNQAESAAADYGAADIKTAAAEQKDEDDHEEN
jgi:hypothetical protein